MPISHLRISTRGQGLYEFTDELRQVVGKTGAAAGLCTLLVRHTSASLTIQENADLSARHDLEAWLSRLVPESDSSFTHTLEGPDDMPAHIKAALTSTSLSIPIEEGRLALGTWQGVYLWEHRRQAHTRDIVVHLLVD